MSEESAEVTVDRLAPIIRGIGFDGSKGPIVHAPDDAGLTGRLASAGSGGTVLVLQEEELRAEEGDREHAGLIERVRRRVGEHLKRHGRFPVAVAASGRSSQLALLVESSYDRALETAARAKAGEPLHDRGLGAGDGSYGTAEPAVGGAARVPAPEDVAQERAGVVRDKVCVVTGGAQGFGAEIVRGLTAAGALVFVMDLNVDGAAELADRMNREAGRTACVPVGADVSDETSVRDAVGRIVRAAGGVDVFISNAGVLKAGSVKELSYDEFRLVTSVNYAGFFLCTKHIAPVLELQNRAAGGVYFTDILQLNSKSGLEGSNRNGAYAGSKFGGIGLVQSFAKELIEDNVKVNAICPGNFFEGPLWSDPEKGLFVQYLHAGKVPGAQSIEDVKQFYESRVPMNRGCLGADVVRAILYCIEQRYETGQAVPVTGGQVMLA